MLNRRHLRVKVVQTLYAYSLSEDKDIKTFEKALLKNVD
ncbi:MAG TPA: transcription antitermination factor NusB, partial [Sphingobacterium sp.]|nr:transcription antitermination factor NusB [Sphingobacterium sp.]